MHIGKLSVATAAAALLVVGLAACSDDPDPTPTPTTRTATAAPSGGVAPSGPAPAWQHEANFDSSSGTARRALVKVYPLQRISGRVLLTIDILAEGTPGTQLDGLNYFCNCVGQGDLQDVSLVDTVNRVRFGPLRDGSDTGPTFASQINRSAHDVGTTWRVGAFFADPGADVTAMGVDLQLGGIAPAIPLVDGGTAAPGLLAGNGAATQPTAEPTSVATPNAGAPIITWTVPVPGADAWVDRHDLLAKVVGGTVNEGGNKKQGIVSLNADVLFDFDSAKLSGKASGLIAEAKTVLSDKADPGKPVTVTGYTDSKGGSAYNQPLSERRAQAVTKALGKVGSLKIKSLGRADEDPVAPNSKSDGSDNPRGRALNRRVEITYTPKPAPAPTTEAPAPTTAAPTPGATGGADGSVALPPATVKSSGVSPTTISATVHPIVGDGTFSLVTLDIVDPEDSLLLDAFTSHSKANQDIGAFNIVDPGTKRVYTPAYDSDNPNRVMGTYVHRLTAGQSQQLSFYTAAIPSTLTSADVDLGPLGVAKNVPVVH